MCIFMYSNPYRYIYVYACIIGDYICICMYVYIHIHIYCDTIRSVSRSANLCTVMHIGMICMCVYKEIKLVMVVEGDLKAAFLIATTPRCRGEHYSFPWIGPPYP